MQQTFTIRTEDMPDAMRSLYAQYPREHWPAHPGFHQNTQHWLAAHQMFRQGAALIRENTQEYLDKTLDEKSYATRLSRYGGLLLRALHGHHGWEDHVYFPELSAADPRFDAGLALLEQDHADLDQVLDAFSRSGTRGLQMLQMGATEAKTEFGAVLDQAETIERFLDRHLADEEELAVPIILHHRLRG